MPNVQHIVLMKFQPDATEEQIANIFTQLAELRSLIPGIDHFSGGPCTSQEGRNKGYTHGFLMTFENQAALDTYLPHPEHGRVKAAILAIVDEVLAFDFEV